MVSSLSIVFIIISMIISIFFPVVLFIIWRKKYHIPWGAMGLGIAVFIVFQLLTRIPLIQVVLINQQWYINMSENTWLYGLFLGFTAGLFEEGGRYLVLGTILKKRLSWETGLSFGIGHGGIESILLVGMTYMSNLVYAIMINTGTYASIIEPFITKEQSEYIVEIFNSTQPILFLAGGLERVMTVFIQIALTLIIVNFIMKGKGFKGFLIALTLHTILDFIAVILAYAGAGTLIIEGVILIFAVLAVIYIVYSKDKYKNRLVS